MKRVLVCGGRYFNDVPLLTNTLDAVLAENGREVVFLFGCATGADELAFCFARSRRIDAMMFAANWEKHGRAAGPLRNQRMIDEGKPDLVVAFAGGRGTADMVRRARAAGVEVREVNGIRKAEGLSE